MKKKHFYWRWSLFRRLRACRLILCNKEFYLEVIISRYNNGDELGCEVLSNINNTETAVKRLIKNLKQYLNILREEKRHNNYVTNGEFADEGL